jgi:hypothetical protein
MATWESFSAFGASAFSQGGGGRWTGRVRGRRVLPGGNGLWALTKRSQAQGRGRLPCRR